MQPDSLTKSWIRNEADARAAANGYRFDLERACWTVWWIERFCRLYEGEWAGEPLILRGAHSMPMEASPYEWDDGGYEWHVERAHQYQECFSAGEPCDWQYECTMRLFGWVKYSERWGREVRRIRRAGIWVPKKCKKSPTAAAISLYLTAGDGEMGGKVFPAAKDGSQAREIVGQHALEMVLASEEMSAVFEINRTKMRLTHLPSKSYLQPLSSGDARSQKSKEGLNGSIVVDEVHVVDREYIERIERAGISRSEPFLLQFSTAGLDADCYGKEEYDYGEENNRTGEDESYFYAYYGAPQKLTDKQLADDPAGVISEANPALGHTVGIEEALNDYKNSCRSIRDLANFKTYRLNIWQQAANPWLRADHWQACRREFTEDDLAGMPCGAGLDLGKTDDMTSLALVFPEDAEAWLEAVEGRADLDEIINNDGDKNDKNDRDQGEFSNLLTKLDMPVKVLNWYWLPEEAVEKYKNEVPQYEEWSRDGILRMTTGAAINQTEILRDLFEIFAKFDVRMFAHDPWYAELIVNELKKSADFPGDAFWPFQQQPKFFAFPCTLYEQLVIEGKLHHNGNPITDWQAGHVQVKEDVNGNIRPIKPPRKSRKKIDGIVSGIMGLDATTRIDSLQSVYEERGIRYA